MHLSQVNLNTLQLEYHHLDVSENSGTYPLFASIINRVFHYFHHPFLGYPDIPSFENTHFCRNSGHENHHFFISSYAPWCGRCRRDWQEFPRYHWKWILDPIFEVQKKRHISRKDPKDPNYARKGISAIFLYDLFFFLIFVDEKYR